ncbi:MAG: Fic family protein [archaeon]|nr:Fic family protein [archaeon]
MVFVEKQKKNGHIHYYLAKSFREEGKIKKTRIFLGTDLTKIELTQKAGNATIELGEIDFQNVLSQTEIKEFDEIKKKLNNIISKMEPRNFYEHFLTQYTYDSNAIEGSTLTLKETGNLLFEKISPKNKQLKHVKEAENHKQAFDYVNSLKTKKLSQEIICTIQKEVVKGTLNPGMEKFEGNLRTLNVRVGTHIAPPYFEVGKKLNALIKWHNANWNKFHPLVVIAYFHSEFENIHPFVDGNGRTGRLLINFTLKNSSYPPLNIFLKFRFKYYDALEKASKEKNLKPLIKIIKESYKEMIDMYGK